MVPNSKTSDLVHTIKRDDRWIRTSLPGTAKVDLCAAINEQVANHFNVGLGFVF